MISQHAEEVSAWLAQIRSQLARFLLTSGSSEAWSVITICSCAPASARATAAREAHPSGKTISCRISRFWTPAILLIPSRRLDLEKCLFDTGIEMHSKFLLVTSGVTFT